MVTTTYAITIILKQTIMSPLEKQSYYIVTIITTYRPQEKHRKPKSIVQRERERRAGLHTYRSVHNDVAAPTVFFKVENEKSRTRSTTKRQLYDTTLTAHTGVSGTTERTGPPGMERMGASDTRHTQQQSEADSFGNGDRVVCVPACFSLVTRMSWGG